MAEPIMPTPALAKANHPRANAASTEMDVDRVPNDTAAPEFIKSSSPALQAVPSLPDRTRPSTQSSMDDTTSLQTAMSRPINSTPRPIEPTPAQRSPDNSRPLNVTDALSYLDAVKVQFQDKPEVYNKFLDIMKDFKGQVIDTPGVIQRVSMLFHGNGRLITGFNTFLPMGYRIDVSADPADQNTITVTTPQGTVTQSTTSALPLPPRPPPPPPPPPSASVPIPGGPSAVDIPGFGPNLAHPLPYPPGIPLPLGHGTLSRSMTPQAAPFHPVMAVPTPFDHFGPSQHHQAATLLGSLNNKHRNPDPQAQQHADFHHAIQYLNKIKARFSDNSNTYKQFLDILHGYQKEQKRDDVPVFGQVQNLFKDAPDLLAEFKDFLPEIGAALTLPQLLAQNGPSSWNGNEPPPPPPPVPQEKQTVKKPTQSATKRRKRPIEKDTTPAPAPKASTSTSRAAKKPKHAHGKEPGDSPAFSPFPPPSPPLPPQSHGHGHPNVSAAIVPTLSSRVHHLPPPPIPEAVAPNKLMFFDRAKRTLEGREIYEEFLKLLTLFSKDILDIKTLLERSRAFLGDGDLMAEFKELLSWDTKQDNLEDGPPGSIRTGPPEAAAATVVEDGLSPSYRRLPDSEIYLACSGRTELHRSVLNDVWVSHPTWASEDSGFQTHKKNSFEEALHRCEEERHEYHVQLQALSATINHLEPLYTRIEDMSHDERTAFRLKADLGGPGRCLYERILKKIYKDNAAEVIKALQEYPAMTIPIVLSRLKNKDEEWRRAQREWSRTWREVDSKNFYKSLDYQGVAFKINDKKCITAKHFVADLEALKETQLSAYDEQKNPIPACARGSIGFQLEYEFTDIAVIHDSLKLVFSFLDRAHTQYGPAERRGIEGFLRNFVPALFLCNHSDFNDACGPFEANQDDEHEERGGRRSAHSVYTNGFPALDLRKRLLKTARERAAKDSKDGSMSGSRAGSPMGSMRSSSMHADSGDTLSVEDDVWIRETIATGSTAQNVAHEPESERPFFTNTTFYTLIRLLQLLYSRLKMCKEIGERLAKTKHADLLVNPVAVKLGLDDPNGPATLLGQTVDILNDRAKDGTNIVYMYLLDACEKFFSNELDAIVFEEHMRWFFGNKAYQLFTVDKLIVALVKQVQTIIGDSKCQELWSLLQSMQHTPTVSIQDVIRYRIEAERHVGQDDNLYRLQWVQSERAMKVQLLSADDPSVSRPRTTESRWREYVHSFVLRSPTEWGVQRDDGRTPRVFLARNRQAAADDGSAQEEGQMSVRIALPAYKIVYEAGTEDLIWRRELNPSLLAKAKQRQEERRRCKWLF